MLYKSALEMLYNSELEMLYKSKLLILYNREIETLCNVEQKVLLHLKSEDIKQFAVTAQRCPALDWNALWCTALCSTAPRYPDI